MRCLLFITLLLLHPENAEAKIEIRTKGADRHYYFEKAFQIFQSKVRVLIGRSDDDGEHTEKISPAEIPPHHRPHQKDMTEASDDHYRFRDNRHDDNREKSVSASAEAEDSHSPDGEKKPRKMSSL